MTAMAKIARQDGAVIVELEASYDSLSAEPSDRLRSALDEAVEVDPPAVVVLDMSRTTFIDSSFVALLFTARKRLLDRVELLLAAPTSHCDSVLRAVKADTIFRIFPTRKEAVEAARAGR